MRRLWVLLAVCGMLAGTVGCRGGWTGFFHRGAACGCGFEPACGCAYEAPIYNGVPVPPPPPATTQPAPAS